MTEISVNELIHFRCWEITSSERYPTVHPHVSLTSYETFGLICFVFVLLYLWHTKTAAVNEWILFLNRHSVALDSCY